MSWKRDPNLPNNYALAERQLESLERSLFKNKTEAKMYNDAIEEYIVKGCARPLSEEELNQDAKPVYYLPHHVVYCPDKPSTPLRVVFDPACKNQGVSLNSFLCKGPCFIRNLLGIILRFLKDPVAFAGDISKMYIQIFLPEKDTHVHRFPWRNLQTQKPPTIHVLSRMTFGDKQTPDMASYVMLCITKENEEEYPDAATILRQDRYMDDLIHFCSTPQEAVNRMTVLDQVLPKGSFQIKDFDSYSYSDFARVGFRDLN